jgi:hypothetical protein
MLRNYIVNGLLALFFGALVVFGLAFLEYLIYPPVLIYFWGPP